MRLVQFELTTGERRVGLVDGNLVHEVPGANSVRDLALAAIEAGVSLAQQVDQHGLGIALINSVGNLGGYIGPFVIGALKEYTGNLASGLYFLSGVMLFGLFLTFVVYRTLERKHVLQPSEFAASARAATHL